MYPAASCCCCCYLHCPCCCCCRVCCPGPQAGCATLKEAAELSGAFRRVEEVFAAGDLPRVADMLRSMARRCGRVVGCCGVCGVVVSGRPSLCEGLSVEEVFAAGNCWWRTHAASGCCIAWRSMGDVSVFVGREERSRKN